MTKKNRIRILKCAHLAEWDVAKKLRQKYFFDPLSIADPYTWTFNHKEHAHLIFYQGVEMIGYAHIQFWPDQRAALRIFVIDEPYRQHGLGSQFLQLCEKWLKKQGIQSLHDEARPDAVKFYRKNGYTEMPFEDPSGELPRLHGYCYGEKTLEKRIKKAAVELIDTLVAVFPCSSLDCEAYYGNSPVKAQKGHNGIVFGDGTLACITG